LDLLREPEAFTIHAIVWHPYQHLLSAWINKFRDRWQRSVHDPTDSIYSRSMRGTEISRMRRFARRRGLAGAEPGSLLPFATFVEYVAATPTGRRNHHWELQRLCLQ